MFAQQTGMLVTLPQQTGTHETVVQDKALRQGVRDIVDRMFGGSSEELVMSLLKSGEIDSERLRALTERFNSETEEP